MMMRPRCVCTNMKEIVAEELHIEDGVVVTPANGCMFGEE